MLFKHKNTKLNTEEDEEKIIREDEDSGWIIFVDVETLEGRIKTGSQRMCLAAKQVK